MSERCGIGLGVDLDGADPDSNVRLDLGLCASTGTGEGTGAGTGRSGVRAGAEERIGEGEGGSIRFWECLVPCVALALAQGGKCCVPFCGRVETGGLIPSLPGAGVGAGEIAAAVSARTCTSLLLCSAGSLGCDSSLMGRL